MAEVGSEIRLHNLIKQSEGTCGSGFNLATAMLLFCLEEDELYTTRSAAETRYRYKSSSFCKMQKAIQNNIRRKDLEKDGVIRGRKAYLGETLKDVLNERGRAKAILGLRLIRSISKLKEAAPPFGEAKDPHKIMSLLNNMMVNDLELLVVALEENLNHELAELLKSLPSPVLEMFLWELGDDGFGVSLKKLPAPVLEEPEVSAPGVEETEVIKSQEVIPFPRSENREEEAAEAQAVVAGSSAPVFGAVIAEYGARKTKNKATSVDMKGRMKRRLIAISGVALCLTALATVYITDPQMVYRTAMEDGPEAALALETADAPKLVLSKAYSHYLAGELDIAEQMVFSVLSRPEATRRDKGVSLYYLGLIAFDGGNLSEALAFYRSALKRMRGNARLVLNRYSIHTAMARVHLARGDLEDAQEELQTAYDLFDSSRVVGKEKYLAIWKAYNFRLCLAQGRFEDALDFARDELQVLEPTDRDPRVSAMSNLAFACMLNGRRDEAIYYMSETDMLLSQIGNPKKGMFNLINWIYYRRCTDQDPSSLIQSVEDFLQENYNTELEYYLQFAQTAPCWSDDD